MWAVKLSFLLVGVFSTIAILVHFAVPWALSLDFVVTTLTAVWTFAHAFLIPPYLFVTLNFIIIVIWILPEKIHHHHHHHQQQQQPDDQPEHLIEITSLKPTDLEHLHTTADTPSRTSSGSPDKTHVVEEEALSLDATWEMIKGGVGGVPSARKKTLEKSEPWEVARPPAESSVTDRGAEMKQSETFSESRRRAPLPRKDVVVVGEDELNRKVEAFIKKMNEQIRLQSGDHHP